MAARSLSIPRSIDEIWPRLQQLDTWEGIGGMTGLRDGRWDDDGDLARFAFSIDTALGDINDHADVSAERTGDRAALHAVADSKGVRIEVRLDLAETGDETAVDFSIEGRSTSFLTKPLVGALRDVLERGIDREGERLVARLAAKEDA